MQYQIIALLACVIGFSVSRYIHIKKQAKKPLMCPRNASCDTVVTSTYATTFGMPNEVIGMTYYMSVVATIACSVAYPGIIASVGNLILGIASAAVLASLYFIAIQAFVLRAWCTWCLLSALANIMIAAAVIGFIG